MEELPPGWVWAPLSEVCTKITDGTHHSPPNGPDGAFLYITAKNIRREGIDLTNVTYVDAGVHAGIYARCPVENGDVLYIKDGATTGLAVVNTLSEPFSLLSSVALLKPNRAFLDAGFLKHWLNAPETLSDMTGRMTGSALRRLTLNIIAARTIPLPPLAEQRRIVARIEALFARTRRARAELGRVAALAPRYRAQVLATTFDADPERGQGTTIADLATVVFDGPFGSNLKSDDYSATGVRVVRLENIGHLRFITEKETFIPEAKAASLARHTLRPGDVLFSSFVDREVRVCVLPDDLPTAAINKADCFCIRVDDACLPEFLAYRLSTPATYEHMRETVHGATRPRISLAQLKQYRVDLPTVDVQRATVKATASARASANKAEAEATRALALLDRLDAAILARAFRGELVPQDPADEPARLPSLPASPRPRRSRAAQLPAAPP